MHYSLRTEQAYVHWVRAFIRFHGVRHPREMGQAEVEAFYREKYDIRVRVVDVSDEYLHMLGSPRYEVDAVGLGERQATGVRPVADDGGHLGRRVQPHVRFTPTLVGTIDC